MTPIPQLQPGDHLLYFDNSFVDWVIAVKTWHKIGHIEIYNGHGLSVASRNGIGVNIYTLRTPGLKAVLRPIGAFDMRAGHDWFCKHAQGQGYDFLGLFCFTLAVNQGSPNKMFCSEFAREWDRAAGIPSFHPSCPGDLVAPGDFLDSPAFDHVWRAV